MSRIDSLVAELAHEAATARRHLERVPADRLDWRPHPRSFSAGQLAAHLVDCIRWVEPVFVADELDFDPSGYVPFQAASLAELLAAFDADVERAKAAMVQSSDREAIGPWRLKVQGKVWFERPREAVFRDFTLSHLIHHRGQLSVYLRLLDVPVPGSYGPSADDQG